jgi:hypothetical protein
MLPGTHTGAPLPPRPCVHFLPLPRRSLVAAVSLPFFLSPGGSAQPLPLASSRPTRGHGHAIHVPSSVPLLRRPSLPTRGEGWPLAMAAPPIMSEC